MARKAVKAKSKVKSKVKSASPRKPAIPARKGKSGKRQRPIELHYWPTPNGWKISIMLEECGLPYVMKPVNISTGDQFKAEFLAISPNNRMPAIVDPDGPGRAADLGLRVGRDPAISRPQDRQVLSGDERARVEVEQWLMWQMGGLGPMAGQAHHFRVYAPEQLQYADRPLHQRGQSSLWRDEYPSQGSPVPCRQIFDRRHGLRRLGVALGAAGTGYQRVSSSEALARHIAGATGGSARHEAACRGSFAKST